MPPAFMTERSVPPDAALEEASTVCTVCGELLAPQLLAVISTFGGVWGVMEEVAGVEAHGLDLLVQVVLGVLEEVPEGTGDQLDISDCPTWLLCRPSVAWPPSL